MKMSGSEFINAPRQRVWEALNDPEILKKSITGCKSLEKESDTEFTATVQAKVGPVKATFNGDVKLSKLKPPQSYVLSGQGKGGVAGFAKGKAAVTLDEEKGGTRLTYDVDAQVGGKLAQIGSRLIASTAKKMAADFFKKFAKLALEEADGEAAVKKAARKPAKKKATRKPAAKKTAAKKALAEKTDSHSAGTGNVRAKEQTASAPAQAAATKTAAQTTAPPVEAAQVPPHAGELNGSSRTGLWLGIAAVCVLTAAYFLFL